MVLMSSWSLGLSIDMWFVNFGHRWLVFHFLVISGNYREVLIEIGYQLVELGKIGVGLVKLDIFMNYWTVQFREISSRAKSLNFEYRVYRAHCVIGLVKVKFSKLHGSNKYTKALGASLCLWFNYWNLSGILFILQARTPGRETILRGNKTERL